MKTKYYQETAHAEAAIKEINEVAERVTGHYQDILAETRDSLCSHCAKSQIKERLADTKDGIGFEWVPVVTCNAGLLPICSDGSRCPYFDPKKKE